ncbi:MAG: universal stress protein [Gammaproteobacteria bacterium]|nr:universal stress protein [Gammaproteobacteria bacterium]
MLKAKKILLASHGTPGGRAAERMAFSLCRAGSHLTHLIVVPDFWKGMMGDDWLNNASTRDIFANYVESQLEREVRKHIRRMMRETSRRKIRYDFDVVIGKPGECLVACAKKGRFDLIVMGSKRPKGKTGYRSHMLDEKLFRSLRAPVMIAPYPHG